MTQEGRLTKEDIGLVLNSWKLVHEDITGVGIAVFMKMFELYPDYQLLFKKFSHIPRESLPNDKVFKQHATFVAKTLDTAIMHFDEIDVAKKSLKEIGKIHARKNMNLHHFIHCNDATIIVLKTALKEKFDSDTEKAWDKVLLIIAEQITRGMEMKENNNE